MLLQFYGTADGREGRMGNDWDCWDCTGQIQMTE